MEDEAQKMVALKKAYAEIILNTAKEAAARVMASEHKALRFQHDLLSTKDESLRVLLRLKQMIDSKTNEAEITSSSQQRRIDELEAQLQEAEDIITDLRSELKQVWSELERVNSNQVKPLDRQITREDASFSESPTPEPILLSRLGSGHEIVPTSGLDNIPVSRGIDHKCCNEMKQSEQLSVSDLDKFYAPDSDLASIIMGSKEPELLRNGCTQRIRAFERNLLDEKVLPSGYVDNHISQGKNELVPKESDKEEGNCNSPSIRDNSMEVINNPCVRETKKPSKVRTLRRRKTRFGKAKTSRQYCPSELMKSRQPTSVKENDRSHEDACIQPSVKAGNVDMTRTPSGLEESLQHINRYYMDEVKTIRKGKRKRKMNSKNGITTSTGQLMKPGQPSSVLSRCRTFAYLGNGGVKSYEDRPNTTQNEARMKAFPCLDHGLTLIDMDPISGSTSVTVSMKEINEAEAGQNAEDKDMELIDVPVLILQESDIVENSEAPSSEFDHATADLSLMNSELKDANASLMNSELKDVRLSLMNSELKDVKASEQSNRSPSCADNGRLLKYTFQRKRKNSSRNPGQKSSFEGSTSKRRIEENECIAQEPQMMNESSRDNRRLAQVARQLISLSGKKWS
ncbi:PREDICTED: LOC110645823 isoform [Prunus dulcis]|uniref:PREDICTED: LOC110645823 isoform n=1 Tax=Prunus dulcis TaxID=3755 RepID=A0A5E4EWP1_PRUDU|nr:uncharacterized protein LOC117623547 [Prunus dulcis]VVA20197.1 PREDICTED: LOC110645823 isoform [Prunus dulcis]